MNLLQIRTTVRTYLAETSPTASYSSDADINLYINEGIKDMCIKGRVYERTRTATITTGIASYVLPLDFLFLKTVLNPSGVSLDPLEPSAVGRVFLVAGKPTYQYISQSPLTTVVRQNGTYYSLGTILIPTSVNGFMYEVTTAGLTGPSPPTYPLLPGTAVTDNNANLVCRELSTTGYEIVFVDTPTTAGGGTGSYTIIYYALDEGLYVDTDSPNFPEDKHHYLVLFAGFRHMTKMKDLTRATAIYTDYAAGVGIKMAGGTPTQ